MTLGFARGCWLVLLCASTACGVESKGASGVSGSAGNGGGGGASGSGAMDGGSGIGGSGGVGDSGMDAGQSSTGGGGGIGGTGGSGPLCTITRVKQAPIASNVSKVYFGTLQPTALSLTDGQILAIGRLDILGSGGPAICSATLIATDWVLTAKHCTEGLLPADIRFAIGHMPDASDRAFTVSVVREHPVSDVALLQLSEAVTDSVPDVTPIRLFTGTLDDTWIGQVMEAAGFGQTEDMTLGTRYFTAEPIDSFVDDEVWVDGQGQHGLCGGDSGGPLLTQATSDGTVRVIGELRGGDTSCVDVDHYTRVDLCRDWIEQWVGATPTTDAVACGALSSAGTCSGNNAVFCGSNGSITTQSCTVSSPCGWSASSLGFRCVAAGVDPCDGYDDIGVCEGEIAKACIGGILQSVDCAACGSVCRQNAVAGVNCVQPSIDPCKGLDHLGRCTGNVAEWCDGDTFKLRDCSTDGLTCAWRGLPNGYYCD